MTAVKIKNEHKTILDFKCDKNNYSKYYIQNQLKDAIFLEYETTDNSFNEMSTRTYLHHHIKVGIYDIYVNVNHTSSCAQRLKEYGKFYITIKEGNKHLNLKQDTRFNKIKQDNLSSRNLIDTIILCQKLYRLKTFL